MRDFDEGDKRLMNFKKYMDSKIDEYDKVLEDFYSAHWIEELALQDLFEYAEFDDNESNHPEHINEQKARILARVILLNQVYSTGLQQHPTSEEKRKARESERKETVDVMKMTERIYNNLKEIIECVKNGDIKAVEIIRGKDSSEYEDAYSFATKYCSFINPDEFPIVDQYVLKMLKEFIKTPELSEKYVSTKIKLGNLEKNYDLFKEVHGTFQNYIKDNTDSKFISCKYTDVFLWECGKSYVELLKKEKEQHKKK